jgi:long-chain acyl-CoA synthetase
VFAVTIFSGAHYFIPSYDTGILVQAIQEKSATHTLLVPTMIRMLAQYLEDSPVSLPSLDTIFYGGSPIDERTLTRVMSSFPELRLLQGYGLTELSPLGSILGPEWHRADDPTGRLRSAGRAALCVEIKIAGEDGQRLPVGDIGQVCVRGPNVMGGYWGKPRETAAALVDGWLMTGDAGYCDAEGFLFIVDRMKDMIVSGGENVYSAEVENAIASHPDVIECAVIGVPDDTWGERVHAEIVLIGGADILPSEILSHCRSLISGYKCPKSMNLRYEPLPKSGAGKILKSDLKTPFWSVQERAVN